jgi:hypothetical protein
MAPESATASTLKLRAEDEEDLAVVSTILQDALVLIGEMAFLPEEKRFALVANRFCWECKPSDGGKLFERTLTGIAFEAVEAVKTRGFDRTERDRILEVLAVRGEPGAVVFDFSGAASMRLEVGRILCHLEDLGEPWPTSWRPRHPLEE